MTEIQIREELLRLSESKYKKFTEGLIPGGLPILGVRSPLLQGLAKDIIKQNAWRAVLAYNSQYHEELTLKALIIANIRIDGAQRLKLIKDFVPLINNWAICDTFCCSLKFAKKEQAAVFAFLQPYIRSDKEFDLRFAAVMLLCYFVNEAYIDKTLKILTAMRHDGYYVKMAVAWALSVCYIKYPKETEPYIVPANLDDDTYKKTLQKIRDSYRTKGLPLGAKK